jgi:3-phosphoshikimate 1-carboxyvinyltransferase
VIDTYDDHRMAMCFSLATLGGCRVRINDPKCVNKTFPEYFETFAGITAGAGARHRRAVGVGQGHGGGARGRGAGLAYLDSGALYRLVALAAMRAGVALDDEAGVAALAAALPARFEGGRVLLGEGGRDVTDEIRSEACSVGASRKWRCCRRVREALFDRQRAYRAGPAWSPRGATWAR